ncbi:hypothetical protein ACI782_14995 [Geodermatophilus sp. SYSU D00703]
MYGQQTTAAGGTAVMAYSGLNAAWYVTAAIGLVFAAFTLVQLVRRRGPARP